MKQYSSKNRQGVVLVPLCQICSQREAALIITRTQNGQKSKISVCRRCASESGIVKIDLNNLLAGLAAMNFSEDQEKIAAPKVCGKCGMTLAVFNQTGRMGCSNCYIEFQEPMEQLFGRIHGHVRHTGKRPSQLTSGNSIVPEADEAEVLKSELSSAIRDEAYERAAELRDRIRKIERSKGGGAL